MEQDLSCTAEIAGDYCEEIPPWPPKPDLNPIVRSILKVRRYKAGYEIRTEIWEMPGCSPQEMRSAYTPSGDYIGNPRWAYRLCKARGIKPEKAAPWHSVCSIGFCEKEQKWYGWSHRAIYGFGIGDVVEEGDCCASSGWINEFLEAYPGADLRLPVGFEAKTFIDAKRMAMAFAESVS